MKHFYFLLLFTCFTFFFCQLVQAQSIFVPAKLVKAPGDTVNGFINFYDWNTSSEEIEFKTSLTTSLQTYPATEVKSFYLLATKEWYYAKTIQIEFYLKRVSENASKIARTVSGTFFLNEIVRGNQASLYLLIDKEQNTRYFIQKDGEFTELIQFEYTTFKEGKLYTNTVNQYINQLKLLLNDCPSINITSSLSYSKTALSQVLTRYYSCKGEVIQHAQRLDQPGYNPILIPGFLKLFGFENYIPSIGIGVKIALPKKFYNRYGLLQLDQYRHNFTEAGRKYTGNSYLVTILGGTYFGKSKIQPFIHGGVQYPSVMWFTAGAGISYAKKINLEIRSPSFSGIMMTMHYTFGKIKK